MQLTKLLDQELIAKTKALVQTERACVTKILHHLREIERRKIFSDFGCKSLFDYAVKELKYSDGQAGRRIQAMRLLNEIPEIEPKITSGELNLSNVSRAQGFFREFDKSEHHDCLTKEDKLNILKQLENKTAREGEKKLASLLPDVPMPKERERTITATQCLISFIVDDELKTKLEEVRALLGPKGATMNFAELVTAMTEVSVKALQAKKFGKKRVSDSLEETAAPAKTPAPEQQNSRYIPPKLRHLIWHRDHKKCQVCGAKTNLQIDHVIPVAKGGLPIASNLRHLCFHCNQRAGMSEFGVKHMTRLRS